MLKNQSDSFESNIEEGNVYVISEFKVTKPNTTFTTISVPCALTMTLRTKIMQTEMTEKHNP